MLDKRLLLTTGGRGQVDALGANASGLLEQGLLVDGQARRFLVADAGRLVLDGIFADADLVGRQRAWAAPTATPASGAALTRPATADGSRSATQLLRAVVALLLEVKVFDICGDLLRILLRSPIILLSMNLCQSAILLLLM